MNAYVNAYRNERVHALKVWPEFFDALLDGRKSFEVRRADREYRVGDVLYLCEWDPKTNWYGPRRMFRKISYLVDLGPIGCRGFVAMQLEHWSLSS